jgi:hypothetical protein
VVDRACPRGIPFEEPFPSELLRRCHHRHRLLSSREAELQSIGPHRLALYGLSAPASALRRHPLSGTLALAVFVAVAGATGESPPRRPLVPLLSRSEFDPNVLPAGASNESVATCVPSFHGVHCPTTLAEAGSDLHRVCLTRLCSAPRVSHPLDASLRLQPVRPCFMPVTPLGFCLQRVSPPGSIPPLDGGALLAVSTGGVGSVVLVANDSPRRSCPSARGSKGLRIREIRSATGRCYPLTARPILSWPRPLRGLLPRSSAPCFHGASSHGLVRAVVQRTGRHHARSSEFRKSWGGSLSHETPRPP